jgi:hypothetical protein
MNRSDLVQLQIVRLMVRLRATIGSITGNHLVVDKLTGEEGKRRVERVSDFILAELGDEDALKRMGKTLKEALAAQKAKALPEPSDSVGRELSKVAANAMKTAGMT